MAAQSDLRVTLDVDGDSFDVVDFGSLLDRSALFTLWQGGQSVRYLLTYHHQQA